MNPQLLAYIRHLTSRDKKTLSQKALKTVEEVGELAKVTLPFDNAFATTHRFVERKRILEECVDTVLCALSVSYDLGFTDAEVEEMMQAKAEKWASLQAREAGVQYPVPFELHVTVDNAPADTFRSTCETLRVKPIVLALQATSGATVLNDVMTSSAFMGDNRQALAELERIADGLTAAGLTVVRKKIETVPWHPAAPADQNGVSEMPPGGYFECHLNILVEAATDEDSTTKRNTLGTLARLHGAHLSRNAFKQLNDNAFTLMMTLRSYDGTREAFEVRRDALGLALNTAGFTIEKLITEFSIYDTKTAHDAAWLKAA